MAKPRSKKSAANPDREQRHLQSVYRHDVALQKAETPAEHLKRHRLTLADAMAAGITVVSAKEVNDIINKTRSSPVFGDAPGLVFSYSTPDGTPIEHAASLRVLATPRSLERCGVGKYVQHDPLAVDHKSSSYVQRFYFPQGCGVDWEKVVDDPTVGIHVVEGCKKAIVACNRGLPTIALAGVWNFLERDKAARADDSRPKGSHPIADFKLIKWRGRPVIISYDADREIKPQVRQAEAALGNVLQDRGASVTLRWPQCECEPRCNGLDDYLLNHSADEFKALPGEPFDQVAVIDARYIKLGEPVASYFNRDNDVLMSYEKLLHDSSRNILHTANGGTIPAAQRWDQTKAVKFSGLLFDPTRPPRTFIADPMFRGIADARNSGMGFNLWRGFPFEAVRGDITPYNELLAHIIPDAVQQKLFRQFCAYTVQHPGVKMGWAVLMWGDQGTGKGAVGQPLLGLHGPQNGLHLTTPEKLHARFNGLLANRTIIFADEVARSKVEADRLKAMITEGTQQIERKGIDSVTADNRFNLFVSSNKPDALRLEPGDRRWFVLHVPTWGTASERAEFFERYWRWWYDDPYKRTVSAAAAAALMYHFQKEVDLADFKPFGHAPGTVAKDEMIEAGRDDAMDFTAELRENPKELLDDSYRYVVTLDTLFRKFGIWSQRPAHMGDRKCLSNALTASGFERKLFNAEKIKGVARQSPIWLIVIDAAYVAAKKGHEVWDYYQNKKQGVGETAPFQPSSHATANGTVPNLEDARKKRERGYEVNNQSR